MNDTMMAAFMDELGKIAASPATYAKSNFAAPAAMKSGMGSNSMVSLSSNRSQVTPSLNPMSSSAASKPTNYSIVNTEAPSAASGFAASDSKSVPPPPVRT